jgi:DNA-binding beta-propeller fold protein YncE
MRLALPRKTHRAGGYLTAVIACCAACLCVGCTGAATHAAGATPGSVSAPGSPSSPSVPSSPPPPLPARALAAPGCSTATAASPALGSVSAAMLPVSGSPFGVAATADGRWLYATSEVASRGTGAPGAQGGASSAGTLTVIDLRRAETDPAASVAATVDAGCQPVRVTTAADGTQVWVTARASDDLLCFAAARLVSDPKRALVAAVRVGEAPVGLAAVRDGSLVVVADSNRFGASGATSDLDVVNVAAALAGRPAVVGHIRAGLFPRDMTLAPDGTLLVSNFDSGEVEAVDVATVPGAPGAAG